MTLVVVIAVTFAREQVHLTLPTLRFIEGAFSGRALVAGDYRAFLTSTLLTRNLFMVLSICVSLLVTMGCYEVAAGHLRATGLALVAAVLGPASVAGGLGLLYLAGSGWADTRLDTLDIGASAIVAASAGALAGLARTRWLTLGLLVFLLGGLLLHHQLADWEHLLIFPWGYLAGRTLGRASARNQVRRSRFLITYLAAATCLIAVSVSATQHLLPSASGDAAGVPLSPPRVVDTHYPAPALGSDMGVVVMLPPGYDSTRRRYPVVVLLHGDPGTPTSMIAAGHLLQSFTASGVAPFIGVAPDGNGPRLGASWFANSPPQAMGTAVAVDLRHWVERTYRTNGSWSYAGLSSGGFAAAYLPLLDPRPVHATCGLGGFYDGRIPPLAKAGSAARYRASAIAHAGRAPTLTFLAYGTSDHSGPIQQTVEYTAALHAAHKHVIVSADAGGHTWMLWTEAFLQCFRAIEPAPQPA